MPPDTDICGVLLAGGQSRRMGGGDKCLMTLGGKTLLQHLIDAARPQVGPMVLNTNSDQGLFAGYRLPVAADVVDGHAGPLAGVLTGLEWAAKSAPECQWVASFACDAPFVPADLVARLKLAVEAEGAAMACAASGGGITRSSRFGRCVLPPICAMRWNAKVCEKSTTGPTDTRRRVSNFQPMRTIRSST